MSYLDKTELFLVKTWWGYSSILSRAEVQHRLKGSAKNVVEIYKTEIKPTEKVDFNYFRPKNLKGWNKRVWDEICEEETCNI